MNWLKKIVPWVVTTILVCYLFYFISIPLLCASSSHYPSYSVNDSERLKILVTEYDITPKKFTLPNGGECSFDEVWIERRTKLTSGWGIIPFVLGLRFYEKEDLYNLCFTLKNPKPLFSWDGPSFRLNPKGVYGSYFGWIGNVVARIEVDSIQEEWKMNFTSHDDLTVYQELVVKARAPVKFVKKGKICEIRFFNKRFLWETL